MKQIRAEVNSALESVGDQFGLVLKLGNGSYRDESGHFKLNISTISDDGSVMTPEAQDFLQFCAAYGFEKSDLKREFSDFSGHRYRILGLKTRSHKYPIIVESLRNGKRYKMDRHRVQAGLKAAA